jgi:hypothetical protein
MDITTARTIIAAAAKNARGLSRVEALVKELESLDRLGNATQAGETVRTLDDLAGHYADGRFVGGRSIAAALRMTQANPSR